MAEPSRLESFRAATARGLFLDFDGSLSAIVERPELARPVEGAVEALERAAARLELVAVVTARTADSLRALMPVEGVEVFGQYGLSGAEPFPDDVRRAMAEVAGSHPGTWVEDKGGSVAVHFRDAAEPDRTGRALEAELGAAIEGTGLRLQAGKRVWEAIPVSAPGKGAVVLREARARGLDGVLFAGDDLADLPAFEALDGLRERGVSTVKVAVRSEETPTQLLAAADVVVDRPAGLVRLLADL